MWAFAGVVGAVFAKAKIRASGLWNVKGLYKEPLSGSEYVQLAEMVEGSLQAL